MFWKRSVLVLAAFLLMLSLVSCSGFFTDPELKSIRISPTGSIVAVGATQQFTAIGVNDDGSTSDLSSVSWESADPAKASVNASAGLVTGVAAGSTTIKATSGSLTASANVMVTTSAVQSLSVSSSSSTSTVSSGSTLQLKATATLSDSSTQDVTSMAGWQSSNTSMATVSSSGLVKGVSTGTVTITATAGSIQGQFSLTVL